MSKFAIDEYGGHDKAILVEGPGDLRLMVDYDDVNHYEVDILLGELVRTLNQHWPAVYAWQCSNRESDDDTNYECWNVMLSDDSEQDECPECGGGLKEVQIG